VYNIHGGAALKFTPSRLDQLADVQARVLEYAQQLASGSCPLPRNQVLRVGTPKAGAGNNAQIPSGIVPGVGGLDSPAILVPSLVI
jgi:hypothetical protein